MAEIRKHFVQLTTSLHLGPLLDELLDSRRLPIYDYEELKSYTRIKQNQMFFTNLDMYGPNALAAFSMWLARIDLELYWKVFNQHLPQVMEPSKLTADILQKNAVLLRNKLNVKCIVPQLYQDGVLSLERMESILVSNTKSGRYLAFQYLLTTSHPKFLPSFEAALEQYQPFILGLLMQEGPCTTSV